ncbi:MAG: phytase [Chitinophagaceae bacterium]|nr:phytase [Chitinophagaceae bacterium]
MRIIVASFILTILFSACKNQETENKNPIDTTALIPAIVTDTVFDDTDDPAIWIDRNNPANSFIIGTDKHKDNGGLYVFNLQGKIIHEKSILGLKRMNNVDVAYDLLLNGKPTDIVVATERDKNSVRIFSMPDMKALDNGGIEVFTKDTLRSPMGIALYTRPSDKSIFVIVGRKNGPLDGYLEQYQLLDNGEGKLKMELVRTFGKFSGKKEIESIAVDNELGYVYYSDEQFGIRKYYADPKKGNQELAIFGKGEYLEDNEGISIYKFDDGTGYILVSNQSANKFNIYPREGAKENPHQHHLISSIPLSTNQSDGSDVTSFSLPGFQGGLFVAMSTDKTFQYYQWSNIAKRAGLRIKK